jgi:hypothetical protein
MNEIEISPELHDFLFGWERDLAELPPSLGPGLQSADPSSPCPCGSGEQFPNCHGRDA